MSKVVESAYGAKVSFHKYNSDKVTLLAVDDKVRTGAGTTLDAAWILNGQDLANALAEAGFVGKPPTAAEQIAALAPGKRFKSSTGSYPDAVYVKLDNGRAIQVETGATFAPNSFGAGYNFEEVK